MLSYLPTHIVVYLCALAAVLGLVMGSALNCLAMRIVAGERWSGNSRSACPKCGHTLSALELIPLISWLIQGGKCRHCKAPISIRYPLTEAILAAVFVAMLLKFGLTAQLLSALVFAGCLLCLSLVDLDTQIIPDRFLLIPIAVRAAQLLYSGGFSALLGASVPGFVIAGAVLVISLIMDKVLKKDTMGGGDIKLLFVIGLYLTLPECLLMIMLSCVIGIAMAAILMRVDSETAFPFGPALSIAAVLTMLVGSPIVNWYLSLF